MAEIKATKKFDESRIRRSDHVLVFTKNKEAKYNLISELLNMQLKKFSVCIVFVNAEEEDAKEIKKFYHSINSKIMVFYDHFETYKALNNLRLRMLHNQHFPWIKPNTDMSRLLIFHGMFDFNGSYFLQCMLTIQGTVWYILDKKPNIRYTILNRVNLEFELKTKSKWLVTKHMKHDNGKIYFHKSNLPCTMTKISDHQINYHTCIKSINSDKFNLTSLIDSWNYYKSNTVNAVTMGLRLSTVSDMFYTLDWENADDREIIVGSYLKFPSLVSRQEENYHKHKQILTDYISLIVTELVHYKIINDLVNIIFSFLSL